MPFCGQSVPLLFVNNDSNNSLFKGYLITWFVIEYLVIILRYFFSYFSIKKAYVVVTHNKCFNGELEKIIPKLSSITEEYLVTVLRYFFLITQYSEHMFSWVPIKDNNSFNAELEKIIPEFSSNTPPEQVPCLRKLWSFLWNQNRRGYQNVTSLYICTVFFITIAQFNQFYRCKVHCCTKMRL